MHGDLKGRMMARLVGNSGLMGHNVVNRFGRRQVVRQNQISNTSFIVLERYPDDLITKIWVTTKQGRKHQVRIHCSKVLGYANYIYIEYIGRKMSFEVSVEKTIQARKYF